MEIGYNRSIKTTTHASKGIDTSASSGSNQSMGSRKGTFNLDTPRRSWSTKPDLAVSSSSIFLISLHNREIIWRSVTIVVSKQLLMLKGLEGYHYMKFSTETRQWDFS